MSQHHGGQTLYLSRLCAVPPLRYPPPFKNGCGFFADSWKLPAYSGAFLLTVDNFSFFAYSWSFFVYSFSFFSYSWSFLAYSGKVCQIRALRDCKQRSLTVSKKAPTVNKKASPFKNPPFSFFNGGGTGILNQQFVIKFFQVSGEKEYAPPPWHPSFLGLSPDLEVAEQRKLWCVLFSWEKKGKRVDNIRVHTTEASDHEKEKRRFPR